MAGLNKATRLGTKIISIIEGLFWRRRYLAFYGVEWQDSRNNEKEMKCKRQSWRSCRYGPIPDLFWAHQERQEKNYCSYSRIGEEVSITRLQRSVAVHEVENRNVPWFNHNSNLKSVKAIPIYWYKTKTFYTTVAARFCRVDETLNLIFC
jgi:hypothetical protein